MRILDLAEYVLLKCERDQNPITNKKLNCLLFLCQSKVQKTCRKKLFRDSPKYGEYPSYPKVYWKYMRYGILPIKLNHSRIIFSEKASKVPPDCKGIVDSICTMYGGCQLYKITEACYQEM